MAENFFRRVLFVSLPHVEDMSSGEDRKRNAEIVRRLVIILLTKAAEAKKSLVSNKACGGQLPSETQSHVSLTIGGQSIPLIFFPMRPPITFEYTAFALIFAVSIF